MVREATYLIELCRAHLNGESVRLDENIDYEKLFSLSTAHNLGALIFCVINTSENKDAVPKEAFGKFQSAFYDSVMLYDMQGLIIEETDSLLTENKIKHLFFKGAELREYYPVPQARVMGDVDLLYNESDRDKVKALLSENGYKPVNSNGPVYDYEKDGVKLEAHTKIISGKIGGANAEPLTDRAMDFAEFDGMRGELEKEFHFVYLIAHLAHHFWFYGAGIRLVFDLAVFQKRFELDFEKIFSMLTAIKLDGFARVILSVCEKWFKVGEGYTDNTEETERFILSYGVFGNSNRNRSAVIERKELEEGKNSSGLATRLRLLFPPYEKLRDIPYIKFIEGRPYLTPLAWIYRIFYNFKYRKSFVKEATKNIGSDESKKEAQRELAYFKEIGLL